MSTTTRTEIRIEGNDVILTRYFDAPRHRVYRAWTDPRQLAAWFGPRLFTKTEAEVDLRPGGAWRVTMASPDGLRYPIAGTYLELEEPSRIVTRVTVDEHPGEWHRMVHANRPPGSSAVHGAMIWTVTLETQGTGTLLTVRDHFEHAADCQAHVKMGMNQGWAESFDRLDGLLEPRAQG